MQKDSEGDRQPVQDRRPRGAQREPGAEWVGVGALEEQRLQHQGPRRLLGATPTCSDVPRAEQSDGLRFVFIKEAWAHDPCILKQPQFPHLLSGG